MSNGITFSGLSSGLDIESIISRLIQIEGQSTNRIATQQAKLQNQQNLYKELKNKIVSFNTALSSLGTSAFNSVSSSVSDAAVASVSVDASAQAGTYNLEVFKLAQAHKISSTSQSSSTEALGFSGEFMVNGKSVTVESTDSLAAIAAKVNSANPGVTASIINGGSGSSYLTFTSKQTGQAGQIQLAEVAGNALSSLGMLAGAASAREAVDADTVRSFGFSSSTSTLQTLTGSVKSGSFQIGAATINVDFATQSLQGVADAINASGSGATATVVSATQNGQTVQKLEISGGGLPASFTDTDGVLQSLGVLQKGFSSEILAAQDAEYKLDGFSLTSAANTVANVVPGATITLLKADATDGAKSTITLSQDTKGLKDKLKGLVNAYNGVQQFIDDNSKFDTETYASGPLFGDSLASQVEGDLAGLIFTSIGSGAFKNMAEIGFSVTSEGKLEFSEGSFDSAYAKDPTAVKSVLTTTGTSTGVGLSFVSSSSKTISGTYDVNITQPATKSAGIASVAQTDPNAGGEVLTFGGQMFGSGTVQLTVDAGASLADLIAKINGDDRLKSLISASDDGGKLKLESKKFGSASGFTIASNQAAASTNSGIGLTDATTVVTGLDIAGTINGEEATGAGQFLVGKPGNAKTDGLQIMYTGSSAGVIGSVTVTNGLTSLMSAKLQGFTDSVNGIFTTADKSLAEQIQDMQSRIENLGEALSRREEQLRRTFAAMEGAMGRMQAQQTQLVSILNGMSSQR